MKYTKVIALVLTLLPVLAAAQLNGNSKVAANVPFEFVVGNTTIPAGTCLVQRSPVGDNLLIQNLQAKVGSFAYPQWQNLTNTDSYSLVFNEYGDHHFLAAVIANGTVYRLPESKREKEVRARNLPAHEQTLQASLR